MLNFINKLTFAIVLLGFSSPGLANTKLKLDFQLTYQTIDNFGASDAWTINPLITKWLEQGRDNDVDQLAELLFSEDIGIGLSAWRFNIGAGSSEQAGYSQIALDSLGKSYRRVELMQPTEDGLIDRNKQLGQIRFIQEAYERGVNDLIAFVNSPPVWATKNGLAHPSSGNGVGSSNLDPEKVDEFSNFIVNVLTYLRSDSVGVPVNYISPVNEPTWEWQGKSQEGNRYNMEDLVAVYDNLHRALVTANLIEDVEIDAGEVVEYTAAISDSLYRDFNNSTTAYSSGMNGRGLGLYRNYIDELLSEEAFRGKIGNKISLHGYFSDIWTDRMGELRDIVYENVKSVSPDAKIWMSEFSILGGKGDVRNFEGNGWNVEDMQYALHVAKVIHRDLTRLNVSAWHWWLAVTPYNYKDGLLKVNGDLDAESVQTSKLFWTFGQFSRFIRPGYERVSLDNPDNLKGLMASAFKSSGGDKLVIVAVNAGASPAPISFELLNLPQGKSVGVFSTYLTNSANNLAAQNNTLLEDGYSVPAESIVTFVAELEDVTSAPKASFAQDKFKIAAGDTVKFINSSSNTPESFSWFFEGGSPESSALENPEVQYNEVGTFDVELTVTNAYGNDTIKLDDAVSVVAEQDCEVTGTLNLETWDNIPETGDYTQDSSPSSIPFSESATAQVINVFELEADVGDNYGTRIRGYLCPPQSGDYTFWIASDNQGELWLSRDESPDNKNKIAYSSDWNNFREWDKYQTQQSAPIYLIAGQKYYVETLHKEHNGGDNLSVGWQLPDGSYERPISEIRLSAFIPSTDQQDPPAVESESDEKNNSGGAFSILSLLALIMIRTKKFLTYKGNKK